VNEDATRSRLIELLQLADAHAGTHHPSDQSDLTRDQSLVLALYANCRSLLRGIIFLLREEHGHEATILMRTLLQDATTIFYIFKNQPTKSEMTLRFEYGSLQQERKLLDEVMKHAPDPESEAALAEVNEHEELTKQQAQEIGLGLTPLPKIEQMFNEVGLSEGYFFFRHASQAVHTSRLALWARMTEHLDGRVTISFGGTPQSVLTVGLFSGELFLNAYRVTARLLAWTTTDEIDVFAQAHQKAFLDLRQEAGVTTKGFGRPDQ
jgi:hypothetical protein